MSNSIIRDLIRLKSISDTGLLYSSNQYDKERYEELREISLRLLGTYSNHDIELLKEQLPVATDYPTAKVDVRALILSANKEILLVKESLDGRWSLPGGWADVGYSPKEIIIKEVKEETGLDVTVNKLLAVFDKSKHDHPFEPLYVYKIVFYCEAISTELQKGFDILETGYFPVGNLPELSENRILKNQIELLFHQLMQPGAAIYFD